MCSPQTKLSNKTNVSSLNPFSCKIQIFKVRVQVSYFFYKTLKIFNACSWENHGHGGHEHGVRRGVFGTSFHLRRCPQGVASVLCKKTTIFGSRRSKLDHLTVFLKAEETLQLFKENRLLSCVIGYFGNVWSTLLTVCVVRTRSRRSFHQKREWTKYVSEFVHSIVVPWRSRRATGGRRRGLAAGPRAASGRTGSRWPARTVRRRGVRLPPVSAAAASSRTSSLKGTRRRRLPGTPWAGRHLTNQIRFFVGTHSYEWTTNVG